MYYLIIFSFYIFSSIFLCADKLYSNLKRRIRLRSKSLTSISSHLFGYARSNDNYNSHLSRNLFNLCAHVLILSLESRIQFFTQVSQNVGIQVRPAINVHNMLKTCQVYNLFIRQ